MNTLAPAAPPSGYRRRGHVSSDTFTALTSRRSRRVTGWIGLTFVTLAAVGAVVPPIPDSMPPAELAAHVGGNRGSVLVGAALAASAALLFFAFASRLLTSRIRQYISLLSGYFAKVGS